MASGTRTDAARPNPPTAGKLMSPLDVSDRRGCDPGGVFDGQHQKWFIRAADR
jgi:hypothetical protein